MSSDPTRWPPRPLLAFAITVAAVLLPLVAALASVAVVLAVTPGSLPTAATWGVTLIAAALGAWLASRFVRALLGLAMLLRLSLAFPDDVPSRFRTALRSGSTRRLGAAGAGGAPSERILALAAGISRHDRDTRGHSERVRAYAEVIGGALGIEGDDLDRLRWAALLHDVGKLEVDPAILNQAGALDDEAWQILRRHPGTGHALIAPLRDHLGPWADTVHHHHERWDGDGYPQGLSGQDICLGARVVAVADAFEVMTGSSRRYRRPDSVAEARQELVRCAGTQFDPAVVEAFVALPLAGVIRVMRAATYGLPIPLTAVTGTLEADPLHVFPDGSGIPEGSSVPDGSEASDHLDLGDDLEAGLDDR